MKRQPSEWKKIFSNEETNKNVISKIYKQLTKLNVNKQPNQKMGARPKQTFFLKKIYRQPRGKGKDAQCH